MMSFLSPLPRFRLSFVILVICVHVISSANETTVSPRQQPRVPKTPKTTTSTTTAAPTPVRRIATHAPWPNDPTPKSVKIATHAPWPGDPGFNRATHSPYPFHRDQYGLSAERDHLYPARSTYAPYVYGSSSGAQDAKKKNVLSVFDKDRVSGWAKDIVAYLAAPFMMPSAIGNAIGNIPSGLEVETLWGRIAKSLKSALNRRSEERNAAENTADGNHNVLKKMKKKLGTTGVQSIASLISKKFRMSDLSSFSSSSQPSSSSQSPKSSSTAESKKKSVDKKFRDIVMSRLAELLSIRKLPVITHSPKSTKSTSSSSSGSSSSS